MTSYTYSPVHGGVLTETKPAGANGVQPVTAYSYSQIPTYAITTAGGSPVQVGLIWEVTGTYTCATSVATVAVNPTDTGATLSCGAGASDEIIKTTSYAGSYNALPTSVTTGSGDGALSRTETYAYDNIGNLISVTKPMGSANAATPTVYIYDADRRKTGEIGPAPTGNGHYRATRTTYDGDGRIILDETGYTTSQSDTTFSTFVSLEQAASVYDASGRKIQDAHSGGGVTSTLTQYSYDALDRLICTAVRMNPSAFAGLMATFSSSTYTASGVLPTAACSLGPQGSDGPDRITYRTYDSVGQLLQTVLGYGTSSQTADHTSTYTLDGKEATAADGNGNLTTFTYDGFNRLSQVNYPNPSGGGSSSTSDYEVYGYDSNSNMLTDRRRDGNTLTMSYDALNREITKSGPSISSIFLGYDLMSRKTAATYNSTTGPGSAYSYDALGRVTQQTTYNWPITFRYDLAGDRTAVTWWDGVTANYTYDTDGELSTLTPSATNAPVASLANYSYDDLGRKTAVGRGNGVSTAYGYDGISRLTSLSHTMAGGNVQSQAYTLGYNAASQINSLGLANLNYLWTNVGVSQSYTVNGQNELTTVGSLNIGYDARGNLNSDGVNTYNYDLLNRLGSTGNGVSTLYDPEDRLISITSSGTATQFAYAGPNVAIEFNGATGQIYRRYVPGDSEDEPVVWFEGSDGSNPRWFLQDHQGSVVAVTDMTGGAISINTYDEYGTPALSNLGRYQFTGQFYLPEIGLYDYKARLYSPTKGRFMQTDPAGYQDGLNWYLYVHNDPVNGSDPSGDCDTGTVFASKACDDVGPGSTTFVNPDTGPFKVAAAGPPAEGEGVAAGEGKAATEGEDIAAALSDENLAAKAQELEAAALKAVKNLKNEILPVPPNKANVGDRVDISIFTRSVRGSSDKVDPRSGYKISPDRGGDRSHGGSAYKLLDPRGARLFTLDSSGNVLRK